MSALYVLFAVCSLLHTIFTYVYWWHGEVAGWARRTCDQEMAGSTAGLAAAAYRLWTSCSHSHSLVPLSRSTIVWYRLLGGEATDGKVTVGLALHWPCVTDFGALCTYGLKAYRKVDERRTSPRVVLRCVAFRCERGFRDDTRIHR